MIQMRRACAVLAATTLLALPAFAKTIDFDGLVLEMTTAWAAVSRVRVHMQAAV